MHSQDIPGDRVLSPEEADRKTEAAVLSFVLREHPDPFTEFELVLAFHRDAKGFAGKDAIRRAIGELIGAGLLRRIGALVLPTRSALYVGQLELN